MLVKHIIGDRFANFAKDKNYITVSGFLKEIKVCKYCTPSTIIRSAK